MPSKARYALSGQWQTNTPTNEGSWWEEWKAWLHTHSSGKIKPPAMGNKEYAPLEDAPGSHVLVI
ncbi:MAG: hypothetical protein K2Q12_11380 [Rickettsiales bacterium]|nr:hypothetical protein [Rickettsiales bacterium]